MPMDNSRRNSKIAAGCFLALSILSFLFGFSGWFLVPPDPAGNVHGVMTAKIEMGVSGLVVAMLSFFLFWRYLKKTYSRTSDKESINNV